ncbi:hypothetical protein Tter_2068 [Thermobaculum terrenum ATCC BAA-798]|uniref:Uncharacterized protein n=1 Tax=Thermobaculum terrenum (strain ATCC BAA-798 / CCMEE 7001 / YNP1) TaxID=525904 RepID=D1CGV0_THET1|nr:hypothetical protein [Thermobaculum terrenum]ACZ42971.1 hypothetical protein Tter_2068 [Thermobaculum terrenum ATCC BAA-798]
MEQAEARHIYVLYMGRSSRDELEAACVLAASDPSWRVVVLLPELEPLPGFELALLEATLRELATAYGVEVEVRPRVDQEASAVYAPVTCRRPGLRSTVGGIGSRLRRYGGRLFSRGKR